MVSTGQCAALVQHYTRVGRTSGWKEGEVVKGSTTIKRGTAIATFVGGIYENEAHGNHAALYISQDSTGIKVVEQWTTLPKPQIRVIPFLGKTDDGTGWKNPSNNGDAFSIIEL